MNEDTMSINDKREFIIKTIKPHLQQPSDIALLRLRIGVKTDQEIETDWQKHFAEIANRE